MKKQAVKFPLVRILWRDHFSDVGWHFIRDCSEEDDESAIGDTIAYLVGENRNEYIVTSTLMSGASAAVDPLHILKSCIMSMELLSVPKGFPKGAATELTQVGKEVVQNGG